MWISEIICLKSMACVLFNPVVVGASLLYQKNEQLKNFQIYVDNSSIQVKIYTALSTDYDVDFQGRSSRSCVKKQKKTRQEQDSSLVFFVWC